MALSKRSSVDQTLELVRDADKFKSRIEELAKMEMDANASIDKANATIKEKREESDKIVKDIQMQRKVLADKIAAADSAAASAAGLRRSVSP